MERGVAADSAAYIVRPRCVRATDGAIESLGILTALRSHNDDYGKRDLPAAMIRDFQLTSSPLTTPAGDTKRKKRRGDTSPSPFTGAGGRASSPISSRSHDAPAVAAAAGRDSYEGTPSRRAAAASGAATPSATGRPGLTSRRGTVSSRDGPGKDAVAADPARARKEALASQLPLAKGRKVAFHQPSKVAGKVSRPFRARRNISQRYVRRLTLHLLPPLIQADSTPLPDDSDDWILALVVECTNQTTHRYIVQDVEGDDPTSTPPTFHTTLKSIVPLPESASTLPEKDYAVGTEVMALYPDTSCFYKAVVKGGGPGLGVLSRKQVSGRDCQEDGHKRQMLTLSIDGSYVLVQREKRGNDLLEAKYQLEFEDDGGDIKSVAAYLVVERP